MTKETVKKDKRHSEILLIANALHTTITEMLRPKATSRETLLNLQAHLKTIIDPV